MALIRERYPDFGPSLAAEKLGELHGLEVSTETLRKWMIEAGLWLSRKQRRTFHQPRRRRESLGELIQIVDQYVEIYHFADGQLDVRWRGLSLPLWCSTRSSA